MVSSQRCSLLLLLSIYLYLFFLLLYTLSLFVRLLGLLETVIPPDRGTCRGQPKSSGLPQL